MTIPGMTTKLKLQVAAWWYGGAAAFVVVLLVLDLGYGLAQAILSNLMTGWWLVVILLPMALGLVPTKSPPN